MQESNVSRLILLALGVVKGVRLFRNNVGMGWTGKAVKVDENRMMIENARPLHAGLIKGSSDLIGWTTKVITPDMLGKKVAIFTAIEVKKPGGRATKEQQNFVDQVKISGGIAGIAKDEETAKAIITKGIL